LVLGFGVAQVFLQVESAEKKKDTFEDQLTLGDPL
jgi:hypothetical protein